VQVTGSEGVSAFKAYRSEVNHRNRANHVECMLKNPPALRRLQTIGVGHQHTGAETQPCARQQPVAAVSAVGCQHRPTTTS
jgi:hypothetical protein